uniref:Uncharacterized protein n=1 Tax=Anopheles stephensi TaxID=30069 RepID=A0A182YRP7_ANOST
MYSDTIDTVENGESLTSLCMVIACVSFPFGWNSDEFRKVCGPESNRFEVGLCSLRWAYPLAIIGEYRLLMKRILLFIVCY